MKEEDLIAASNEALADLFGDAAEMSVVEAPEAPTAPLPVDSNDRLRDESGKFVAKPDVKGEIPGENESSTEEAIPAVVETAPEVESGKEPGDAADELVLELPGDHVLFTKYEGDVTKALKALEDSQVHIGRQSEELGELRRLRDEMQALRGDFQNQMLASSVDWDELITEDPQAATMRAVELQNTQAFDAAWSAWAEESPAQAYLFMQRLQQYSEEPAPQAQGSVEDAVGALREKYPDLIETLPAIQTMAAERPQFARALAEGTPRDRAQALEDLYHLARSRTVQSATSEATKRIILRAAKEADAAKADAAVVGASNTTVVTPAPNPDEVLQQQLRDLTGLEDFVIV